MKTFINLFSRPREGEAVVANLGKENKMYYNNELQRWVEPGTEDAVRKEMETLSAPPPKSSTRTTPSSTSLPEPVSAADQLCQVANYHRIGPGAHDRPLARPKIPSLLPSLASYRLEAEVTLSSHTLEKAKSAASMLPNQADAGYNPSFHSAVTPAETINTPHLSNNFDNDGAALKDGLRIRERPADNNPDVNLQRNVEKDAVRDTSQHFAQPASCSLKSSPSAPFPNRVLLSPGSLAEKPERSKNAAGSTFYSDIVQSSIVDKHLYMPPRPANTLEPSLLTKPQNHVSGPPHTTTAQNKQEVETFSQLPPGLHNADFRSQRRNQPEQYHQHNTKATETTPDAKETITLDGGTQSIPSHHPGSKTAAPALSGSLEAEENAFFIAGRNAGASCLPTPGTAPVLQDASLTDSPRRMNESYVGLRQPAARTGTATALLPPSLEESTDMLSVQLCATSAVPAPGLDPSHDPVDYLDAPGLAVKADSALRNVARLNVNSTSVIVDSTASIAETHSFAPDGGEQLQPILTATCEAHVAEQLINSPDNPSDIAVLHLEGTCSTLSKVPSVTPDLHGCPLPIKHQEKLGQQHFCNASPPKTSPRAGNNSKNSHGSLSNISSVNKTIEGISQLVTTLRAALEVNLDSDRTKTTNSGAPNFDNYAQTTSHQLDASNDELTHTLESFLSEVNHLSGAWNERIQRFKTEVECFDAALPTVETAENDVILSDIVAPLSLALNDLAQQTRQIATLVPEDLINNLKRTLASVRGMSSLVPEMITTIEQRYASQLAQLQQDRDAALNACQRTRQELEDFVASIEEHEKSWKTTTEACIRLVESQCEQRLLTLERLLIQQRFDAEERLVKEQRSTQELFKSLEELRSQERKQESQLRERLNAAHVELKEVKYQHLFVLQQKDEAFAQLTLINQNLTAQLADVQAEHDTRFNALNVQYVTLQAELQETQLELTKAVDHSAQQTQELLTLKKENEVKALLKDHITHVTTQYQADVAELQQALASLTAEKHGLEARCAELQNELNIFTTEKESAQQQEKDAQVVRSQMEAALAQAETEKIDLRAVIESQQNQLSCLTTERMKLLSEIQTQSQNMGKEAQAFIEDKEKAVAALKAQIDALEQQLSSLVLEKDLAKRELTNFTNEMSHQITVMQQNHEATESFLRENVTRLEDELHAAKTDATQLNLTLKTHEDKVDDLEAQVAELLLQNQTLKEENKTTSVKTEEQSKLQQAYATQAQRIIELEEQLEEIRQTAKPTSDTEDATVQTDNVLQPSDQRQTTTATSEPETPSLKALQTCWDEERNSWAIRQEKCEAELLETQKKLAEATHTLIKKSNELEVANQKQEDAAYMLKHMAMKWDLVLRHHPDVSKAVDAQVPSLGTLNC